MNKQEMINYVIENGMYRADTPREVIILPTEEEIKQGMEKRTETVVDKGLDLALADARNNKHDPAPFSEVYENGNPMYDYAMFDNPLYVCRKCDAQLGELDNAGITIYAGSLLNGQCHIVESKRTRR